MNPRDVPAAHSMDTAWFAVDEHGRIGVFDTGEPGALPEAAATLDQDPEVLAALGFTEAEAAVVWGPGASRQDRVFVFEHDDALGFAWRYVRRHAPARPAMVDDLPPHLRARLIKLPVDFATTGGVQPAEHVRCGGWADLWISADGRRASPFDPAVAPDAGEVAALPEGVVYDGVTPKRGAPSPVADRPTIPLPHPDAAKPGWRVEDLQDSLWERLLRWWRG